ncbi:MAG: enoyl-CoA hydratase-related protein [Anaerolineales bacterium]|nr:enoyl-CoA hydratase-related protein [Anaerolineales bacterium]
MTDTIPNTGGPMAVCETLVIRLDGAVLHVTLNRPESRNAMSLRMVQELQAVLRQAEQGGAVRVLVLRGAGGHFCAGGDLKDMAAARMRSMPAPAESGEGAPSADPVAEVNARFGELCVAYANTPLALVAVAEGTVMGGGFGLACVADVALASSTAVFRLPETGLGVVPAQIAPFLVERLGYSQAKRLAVTGGRIGAEEALRIGLVHAVHQTEQIDAALASVLADILGCAPGALAATKALIAKARWTPAAELVVHAGAVFSRAVQSGEGVEGTSAFLQKRKPKWATP